MTQRKTHMHIDTHKDTHRQTLTKAPALSPIFTTSLVALSKREKKDLILKILELKINNKHEVKIRARVIFFPNSVLI